LSDKIDAIMLMLSNDRTHVDPNNVPLASLVAQEQHVDVNFIRNNLLYLNSNPPLPDFTDFSCVHVTSLSYVTFRSLPLHELLGGLDITSSYVFLEIHFFVHGLGARRFYLG
jgi:hypothetical protein